MQIDTSMLALSIVVLVAAAAMAVIAILSYCCKGPLISQAWTMATPEQRETIDKKAEYRSVAIVFTGLAVAFVFIAGYLVYDKMWLFWLAIVAAALAVWLGMLGGINRFMKFKKTENTVAQEAEQIEQENDHDA